MSLGLVEANLRRKDIITFMYQCLEAACKFEGLPNHSARITMYMTFSAVSNLFPMLQFYNIFCAFSEKWQVYYIAKKCYQKYLQSKAEEYPFYS